MYKQKQIINIFVIINKIFYFCKIKVFILLVLNIDINGDERQNKSVNEESAYDTTNLC